MQFNDRTEVEIFERHLANYLRERSTFPIQQISLLKAYDQLQARSDGGRVFTALADIVVNLSILWCDVHDEARAWGHLVDAKVLDQPLTASDQVFGLRMDMQRATTAFVFRYRALWDKIMGFLILFFAPDRYEDFSRSKSKRRTFSKLTADFSPPPKSFIDELEQTLLEFEQQFRTPEAHGTGALRKIWLQPAGLSAESYPSPTLPHWNFINAMAHTLGGLFNEEQQKSSVS